ncbi:MAG: response regulator transcription factor [Pseudomonadota bacterium]
MTQTDAAAGALADDALHILVVDDDERIRDLLGRFLVKNGYRTTTAGDVATARARMQAFAFDLLILDLMMPGESGMSFAEDLRRSATHDTLPILMLTAQAASKDRIDGLEAGADDYLTKPFEPRELLLRINNILVRRRPTSAPEPDEVRMGPFVFHPVRGELRQGQEQVRLTERERELLRILASRAGEAIPRHELATDDTAGSDRAVDVQINRLRRKLEVDPSNPVYLQTSRGKGYVLYID